jgi:hypothetical protein
VIVCDYHALLQSITGLLRESGYTVFEAYDGQAAEELCLSIRDLHLLVLIPMGRNSMLPGWCGRCARLTRTLRCFTSAMSHYHACRRTWLTFQKRFAPMSY